jgi:acetyl esterase/lipase
VQAALIVDVLRAHQLVMDGPSFAGLVDKVIFMGHSLGGACSIIAAAKVQVRHHGHCLSLKIGGMQWSVRALLGAHQRLAGLRPLAGKACTDSQNSSAPGCSTVMQTGESSSPCASA